MPPKKYQGVRHKRDIVALQHMAEKVTKAVRMRKQEAAKPPVLKYDMVPMKQNWTASRHSGQHGQAEYLPMSERKDTAHLQLPCSNNHKASAANSLLKGRKRNHTNLSSSGVFILYVCTSHVPTARHASPQKSSIQ